MKQLEKLAKRRGIRLDDADFVLEKTCQDERANWLATRFGLPAIGCKLLNKHGIEWVVQNHATVPTADSLQRWRTGEIQPETDLYPVVNALNFSPRLMDFFHAIDRCTTKTFAMLDTMPGRRKDGHVPGGNSIDTASHPLTNLLFLDAARVHETVVAHEFGHAWVQYVDECEDLRTLEDASDPQRLRMVNFVQSFVLDLKVNDLLRSKGFDMEVIESDQVASFDHLAIALEKGYRPETPREQVFMSLLIADQILRKDAGPETGLARFDTSLQSVRKLLAPVSDLAEKMADSVGKHGYDSHTSITACIDECLTAAFEHGAERFDLDRELVLVNPDEPNIDKFPKWIPLLPPKLKCSVGRHMAKKDIPWEWAHSAGPTLTERTRVTFTSPEGARSEVIVPHRIGPPTPYFGMSEDMAEIIEMKRQHAERMSGQPNVPLSRFASIAQVNEYIEAHSHTPLGPVSPSLSFEWPNLPGRGYMAGLGRFLTAARLAEQIGGEHPYNYAFCNPTTYVDSLGALPKRPTHRKPGPRPLPGDADTSLAGELCGGGDPLACKGVSDQLPPCTADNPNYQSCGSQIIGTNPGLGGSANMSNWPQPKCQLSWLPVPLCWIGAEYCCMECMMRVCCAFNAGSSPIQPSRPSRSNPYPALCTPECPCQFLRGVPQYGNDVSQLDLLAPRRLGNSRH